MKYFKEKIPKETRLNPRVHVRIPVSFHVDETFGDKVHSAEESFLHGEAENISTGGLCFFIPIFIPKETTLVLHIQASPFYPAREGINEFIRAKVQVVHATLDMVKTQSHGAVKLDRFVRRYRIGVKFLELAEQDGRIILEYIKNHSKG